MIHLLDLIASSGLVPLTYTARVPAAAAVLVYVFDVTHRYDIRVEVVFVRAVAAWIDHQADLVVPHMPAQPLLAWAARYFVERAGHGPNVPVDQLP